MNNINIVPSHRVLDDICHSFRQVHNALIELTTHEKKHFVGKFWDTYVQRKVQRPIDEICRNYVHHLSEIDSTIAIMEMWGRCVWHNIQIGSF